MIEIGKNLRHVFEFGIAVFGITGIVRVVLDWSVKLMDYQKKWGTYGGQDRQYIARLDRKSVV